VSLDFTAFFRTKPKSLPASAAGAHWIVNVEAAIRIEADDLAPGLRALVGRRLWHVDLHLEGEADKAALTALDGIIAALISADAAIFDPQRDCVCDRDGEHLVVDLVNLGPCDQGFSLHVLFEKADQVSPERMAKLLAIIEAQLPDALPHRYGTYEPTPFRWDQGGADAFVERWDSKNAPFWIGRTPVGHVYSSFDYKPSTLPPAFRAGQFDFQFRSKLATEPAKLLGVLRLAEQFAIELDAFYVALVSGNEIHGPFWKGLIPIDHLLLILGKPLLDVWPEFAALSQALGTNHRKAGGSDRGTVMLRPPPALCYPSAIEVGEPPAPVINGAYAELFPFAKQDPYA